MNDEAFTAVELLAITSRKLPAGAALGHEAAELREAFLRFGAAAEEAGGGYDEAALLAKLSERCLAEAPQPAIRPNGAPSGWWPIVVTVALAASMLVAIVRTAATWPQREPAAAILKTTPSPLTAPMHEPPPEMAPESAPQLAWSDSLDDEIASAQAAVEQLAGRNSGLDGSLENFGSRLQSLSAELEGGSL